MEAFKFRQHRVSRFHGAPSFRRWLTLRPVLPVSASVLVSLAFPSPARAAGAAVTSVPAYPACAQVGSTATISGSGYGTGSGPIQVWIDQTQVVQPRRPYR